MRSDQRSRRRRVNAAHSARRGPAGSLVSRTATAPGTWAAWTQAARFISYVAYDPMGLMFRVAVLRGARGELCGFRWTGSRLDVPYRDPETGEQRLGAILTVARQVQQLGGKLHEEPTAKSRAGNRLVLLDWETAGLLREHHREQLKAQMAAPPGAWEDNDLVFADQMAPRGTRTS